MLCTSGTRSVHCMQLHACSMTKPPCCRATTGTYCSTTTAGRYVDYMHMQSTAPVALTICDDQRDGAQGQDCVEGSVAAKHRQAQAEGCYCHAPHCSDGRLGAGLHLEPEAAEGHCTVTAVAEQNPAGKIGQHVHTRLG
jgi:hypothetical protein